MTRRMFGFLNLNKPAGLTSHDCVAKVRRLLKIKKVGHGGTLDPAATGVLPIAVGKATRLLNFLPTAKTYRAIIRLGVRTTTDDLEGEVIETKSAAGVSLGQIEPVLQQFLGTIEQIPPAYSAIQRDGKRLYELARAGKVVDVPFRTVEVSIIKVLAWHPGDFPELELEIACGSGTYIRAIARDIGANLNVGGTLAALQRTLSCGFQLTDSVTLEELATRVQQNQSPLISVEQALAHLSVVNLATPEAKRWCQGQKIGGIEDEITDSSFVRVQHQEDGAFLGISELIPGNQQLVLVPKVVLYQF